MRPGCWPRLRRELKRPPRYSGSVKRVARIHPAQRGYILAMLMALMAGMGVVLMKAMPSVITEVKRDNEAELIFRGEAIARAIRLYRAKSGGFPTKLEDLVKVKPRILRQLYRDPMTRDGEWELVTAVQAGASGDKKGLPIAGVRSRSTDNSLIIYRGKTLYSDWIFSATDELLGIPGARGPQAGGFSVGTKSGEPSLPPATGK